MSSQWCIRRFGRFASGFTVVEIVVTIAIVAIVSVVAISRLGDGSTFNAVIVRDGIISLARTAQQNSLGRADVTMTITPSAGGDSVNIVTSYAGGTIEDVIAPLSSVSISGDINNTDSCAVTTGADAVTNAAPMTINFGELGDLGVSGVTGSTGTITSALRICLNDTANESVCVSPSGFAYVGDCDV